MAVSIPPYPVKHRGAVLVCGSAFSLLDDYSKARQKLPDAPCIAVKDASLHIKAFAVFGLHPRKMDRVVSQQKSIHSDFTSHMGPDIEEKTSQGVTIRFIPDYQWPEAVGGSSGWAAVRMAHFMGFDRIVLCGIPMVVGGYEGGKLSRSFKQDAIVKKYRDFILNDKDYHFGVRSMSGWTRDVFGAP